jgi:DNA-binding SARP family transcriptional activator
MADLLEVQLLGPLRVRRMDGSDVDRHEWRTGKTTDLLRLLALSAGSPVPVETILDALWPGADRAKGLASLRTAACHIRRAVNHNCIARSYAGLTLVGASVDVLAFDRLADRARRLVGAQRWIDVITVTREAEAVYGGDLDAHDASVPAFDEARVTLRGVRLRMLLDAAEAALELALYEDAVEFANAAVEIDAFSERAYRTLISGHAGAGETYRAQAAYTRCRDALADELGVDPSPQTRELHRVSVVEGAPLPDDDDATAAAAARPGAVTRVNLLELIADIAAATGHAAEADEAHRAALGVATRYGIPLVERTAQRHSAAGGAVEPGAGVEHGALSVRDLVRELGGDLGLVLAGSYPAFAAN